MKRHRRAGLPLYPPDMQSFFFSSPPPSPTSTPLQLGRQRRAVPPSPLTVERRPLFAFSASAPASPILANNNTNGVPLLVPPLTQFAFPLSTPASPSTATAPLLPPLLVGNHELPSNQLVVPAGGALTAAAAAAAADAYMVDAMVEELRGHGELLVAEARNVDQCSFVLPHQHGRHAFDGSAGEFYRTPFVHFFFYFLNHFS